ncbi:MAG TPA: flagellin [Nocardioidaceae bacterium]|nr:flagellin [Nocardioidaceae bacterium]
MGLRINTNIAAMNAYRNLSVTDSQMSKSLEKLSSGYRINRAADDAAGLAISEGLRSQIGGLKVAGRNTQDAINVVQTADGALNETTSILQRMRDLSVQAANDGGLDPGAKSNIQTEMDQLKQELTRIAGTTQFNGTKLLDGNYDRNFQVGANAGETIEVAIQTKSGQGMDAVGLGVDSIDVTGDGTEWDSSVQLDATTAPTTTTVVVDGNTYSLDLSTWDTGGTSDSAQSNQQLLQTQLDKAFQGTDVTAAVDDFGRVSLKGTSITNATTVKVLGTAATKTTVAGGGASAAINAIDTAIDTVSTVRANLGAYQNRFEHTINNINVAVENLSASESAIRDTDMASEMVNFTRTQILSQAGTAMLAQANQIPQGVLRLLQ